MTLDIAYTHEYLKYKLGAGDGTHMTQPIRAKLATELLTQRLGEDANIITPTPTKEDRTRLEASTTPNTSPAYSTRDAPTTGQASTTTTQMRHSTCSQAQSD
jgi:hypothetical protein